MKVNGKNYYKFLQDYKHTVKAFKKDDVCVLFHGFGAELLKEKIVTEKLSRREVKKIESKDKDLKNEV